MIFWINLTHQQAAGSSWLGWLVSEVYQKPKLLSGIFKFSKGIFSKEEGRGK